MFRQPLSKSSRQLLKRDFGSKPSVVSRLLNVVDTNTTSFTVGRFDPTVQLKGHKPLERDAQGAEYNVTALSNGFTVITESEQFPGAVHMGFLMDVGTRDETHETSGSMLALKNTYLKTLKHTNETINYGMIQMSGGRMQMDYDQERTYFGGHCIEYDVIDMFQMLVDIALEPRSVLAANVARSKNKKSHELHHHLNHYDPFIDDQELLLRTAYGYHTLGMPRLGLHHNLDNIDARMLQQFIMDNVTPQKCYLVGSGIRNHQEFVDVVKERLGELLPVPEHHYRREKSQYIGGEYRTWTETPVTSIQVGFESQAWKGGDVATYLLMKQLVGRNPETYQKNLFVDKMEGMNSPFSDSGIFGAKIQGLGSHSQELMSVLLDELNSLKQGVSDEELNKAKAQLKMDTLITLQNQASRLQELAFNYLTYGDVTIHKYCDQLDAVTSSDIKTVAEKVLQGKPTIVVTGDAINLVPTITDVSKQLN